MKVDVKKNSITITNIDDDELKESLLNEIRLTYVLWKGFPCYGKLPKD